MLAAYCDPRRHPGRCSRSRGPPGRPPARWRWRPVPEVHEGHLDGEEDDEHQERHVHRHLHGARPALRPRTARGSLQVGLSALPVIFFIMITPTARATPTSRAVITTHSTADAPVSARRAQVGTQEDLEERHVRHATKEPFRGNSMMIPALILSHVPRTLATAGYVRNRRKPTHRRSCATSMDWDLAAALPLRVGELLAAHGAGAGGERVAHLHRSSATSARAAARSRSSSMSSRPRARRARSGWCPGAGPPRGCRIHAIAQPSLTEVAVCNAFGDATATGQVHRDQVEQADHVPEVAPPGLRTAADLAVGHQRAERGARR